MTFQIHVYTKKNLELTNVDDLVPDKPDHTFTAKNGRQVVGLIKTIMDNFHPKHVDIIDVEAFYCNEGIKEQKLNKVNQ